MSVGFRSALGVVALAAGLVVPALAQAGGPRVRLEYARGEGAGSCPDARAFAGAVAGRLGYEPFDSTAAGRVMVTIDRRASAFEGRIETVDAQGAPTAERDGLFVQALVAARRYDEARARAARFDRRYPRSLFAPVVTQALRSIP